MEKFFETLSFAIVLIILSMIFIAISLLLTGKSKVRKGMCGKNPNEKRNKDCSNKSYCDLCENEKKTPEEKATDEKRDN